MLKTPGLWRALVQRARAEWPVVLAAGLLLLCATTLLASGALYGDTVAAGGLRAAILNAPPADRTIVVRMSELPADAETFEPIVRSELVRALGETAPEAPVPLIARSGSLELPDIDLGEGRYSTVLGSFDRIADHATLLDGRWPEAGRAPTEATLSEGAAAALGLGVGETVRLAGSLGGAAAGDVTIVGIWRPHANDAYWVANPLELEGIEARGPFTAYGPFAIARDDLFRLSATRRLELQWRATPDVRNLRADGVDALARDVSALRARLAAALPPRRDVSITTTLPATLTELSRSILVSRSGVVLLTVQFAVLAGYAVLLVGGMLVERRRAEVALLRSRGASSVHLAAMALGEGLLLAIPAVVLAPFLAVGVVSLIGTLGPLADAGVVGEVGISRGTVLAAVLTAAVGILVLILPGLVSGLSPTGARAALGRQLSRTLAHRLGLDLALVVLAGVALWQLQLYGAPLTRNARGTLGMDPLLVAAPGIGLLAGGVLATRIVPRVAEVAERLLERRRGLMPPLGARQLARRPLRYTRAALLLMLAVALGTFAAANAATWTQSQAERAAYRAAADARVAGTGFRGLPSWAEGTAYRAIDGVETAMPIGEEVIDVGRTVRRAPLLALDPGVAAGIVASVPGSATSLEALLVELADSRPAAEPLALPGQPRRLALTIDTDLDLAPGAFPGAEDGEIPADWAGINVVVTVEDGDHLYHRFDLGRAVFRAHGQRFEVDLGAAVDGREWLPTGPLAVRSIELGVRSPGGYPAAGGVEVVSLAVSDAASGDAWTNVAFDPTRPGWRWVRVDGQGTFADRREVEGHRRYTIAPEQAIFAFEFTPPTVLRLAAGPEGASVIPAIASDRFLELTGSRVGELITVRAFDGSQTLRIIGSTPLFPPLDPSEAFVIVDGPSRDAVRLVEAGYATPPSGWWLAIDESRSSEIVATLEREPFTATEILVRDEIERRLASDPVPLGIIGALMLGSMAAVAFASVGFVVSATTSASERLGEFALLQALGLSRRQLTAWLSLENAIVLGFGLLGGSALGLLLAVLVLPFSTLTETGAVAVPAPTVIVPWEALLPAYALSAILLLVTIAIVGRQLPGIRLSGVLRARDE